MAKYVDCGFEGTTVVLDGHEYTRTKFFRCRIVVTRGNFSLEDCTFDTCAFEFGGEAANIRNLVMGLVQQSSPTTLAATNASSDA
jgi:hypothetical protein